MFLLYDAVVDATSCWVTESTYGGGIPYFDVLAVPSSLLTFFPLPQVFDVIRAIPRRALVETTHNEAH